MTRVLRFKISYPDKGCSGGKDKGFDFEDGLPENWARMDEQGKLDYVFQVFDMLVDWTYWIEELED